MLDINIYDIHSGPSWLWSYGSSIYNYICNQCLSPLVSSNPAQVRSVTCGRSVVFSGYSSFFHK